MNKSRLFLLQIYRSMWAMSMRDVNSFLPQVEQWIKGNVSVEPADIGKMTSQIASIGQTSTQPSSFDEAPDNSIALIPLIGPMTRDGGWCNFGTSEIASMLLAAVNSKKITGIIMEVDTGGGTTDSIYPLLDAIKATKLSKKPIVGYCHRALSAGERIVVELDHVVAANNMSEFGSIGVFCQIPDNREQLRQEGINMITVYAPESTEKNRPFMEALDGNVELLQSEFLSPIAKDFIESIKSARGSKLKMDTPGLFTGRTFFAKADGFDCIENGLIDSIGNLEHAISVVKSLQPKPQQKSFSPINNFNSISMNRKQLPALLAVLGYENLEMKEGKAHLLKADVEKIQTEFYNKYGKALMLSGVVIEDDGSAIISEKGLFAINHDFTEEIMKVNSKLAELDPNRLDTIQKEFDSKIKQKDEQIKKLSEQPEDTQKQESHSGTGGKVKVVFVAPSSGLNAADMYHPWNAAAVAIANGDRRLGRSIMDNAITHESVDKFREELVVFGASTIDIHQMNEVLGGKYIENSQEIQDMLVANQEISSIFPFRSTGTKDELPNLSLYVSEFLQPRNSEWSEKGGFDIQADLIKIKNWQVSHRYTAAQMWQFIESWLATKTQGTDPFQESLVNWLTTKMMMQISMVERPFNAIRGVYVVPAHGVAGKSINAQDGILINIQKLIRDNRILVHRVGKGDYEFLDGSGNPNKNHVYHKLNLLIQKMPQNVREGFNWRVHLSKNDLRERNRFLKEMVATNANYSDVEKAESYDNFNYVGVPNWPDGLYVISLPGNILQGYREKNDDNRIYFDKEKRDTIVFMDGGAVIAPVLSGKKYDTSADLKASAGETQRIFTNGEFGAYTPLELAAGDTSPSVAVHTVLKTSANAGATVITTIDDAVVGDIIFIIGGSSTNASTIAANNTNFIGLAAQIVFNLGVMAKFQCTATGKFTLLGLFQQETIGAFELEIDDATPNLSGNQLVVTNSRNTAATAITDFPDAVISVPFTVLGGGGTNAATIAKSGKFAYISGAWTGSTGASITLMKRPDGLFIETLD